MSTGARFTSASDAVAYILSGRAIVTLVSRQTGARFTYRVASPRDDVSAKRIRFVSLLTGPSNEADYEYLGYLSLSPSGEWRYNHGRVKSRIAGDATSVKAFSWSWFRLKHGDLPEELEVWHEGTCGRCGRKLTTPESIETGMGPECKRRAGQARYSHDAAAQYDDALKGDFRK